MWFYSVHDVCDSDLGQNFQVFDTAEKLSRIIRDNPRHARIQKWGQAAVARLRAQAGDPIIPEETDD